MSLQRVEQHKDRNERLFISLAEQLGEAFLQITRLTELAQHSKDPTLHQQIHTISEAAMQLTNGYVTSMRQGGDRLDLQIEPVSVGSLLSDAVKALQPFATQRNIQLEIATMPRLEPVLCDRSFVHSALVCLGQVFVNSEAAQDEPGSVILDAYRTNSGIVAGLYSKNVVMNKLALRKARRLFGRAEQPLSLLTAGAATGVFVADTLLQAMHTELHVARHGNHVGLGATLPRCNQIQLV